MTHTPGPWRITDDGFICSTVGRFVPIRTPYREDAFKDGPNRSDHPEALLLANARLIAAAPEMLEALQAIDSEAADINGDGDIVIKSEIWDLIRQAIDKATNDS